MELDKILNTGVVVRSAHNRCLEGENSYLWEYVTSLPVQFTKEIILPETRKRQQRNATLEVRYCRVSIQPPSRLKDAGSFHVYAVYAKEIDGYLAKGHQVFYWYYKLQATEPIFPTLTEGKLSKYKHLGKPGSKNYMDALEQITARLKIDALDRSVETLNQGLKDLIEETSKYKK